MVTWTGLTLNEARGFPSYVVTFMNRCEQVSSQRTTSTSVVVGGLMPHTEYNITVQALTAGGAKEGPLSAPGETDTREHVRHKANATQTTCTAIDGVYTHTSSETTFQYESCIPQYYIHYVLFCINFIHSILPDYHCYLHNCSQKCRLRYKVSSYSTK